MFTFPFVTDPWSALQVLPEVTSCCKDKTKTVTANVSETGRQKLRVVKTQAQSYMLSWPAISKVFENFYISL